LHGVMAGTDTVALRLLYVVSGGMVAALASTRYLLSRRPRDLSDAVLSPSPATSASRERDSRSVAS
jgi:hypothetical protein